MVSRWLFDVRRSQNKRPKCLIVILKHFNVDSNNFRIIHLHCHTRLTRALQWRACFRVMLHQSPARTYCAPHRPRRAHCTDVPLLWAPCRGSWRPSVCECRLQQPSCSPRDGDSLWTSGTLRHSLRTRGVRHHSWISSWIRLLATYYILWSWFLMAWLSLCLCPGLLRLCVLYPIVLPFSVLHTVSDSWGLKWHFVAEVQ